MRGAFVPRHGFIGRSRWRAASLPDTAQADRQTILPRFESAPKLAEIGCPSLEARRQCRELRPNRLRHGLNRPQFSRTQMFGRPHPEFDSCRPAVGPNPDSSHVESRPSRANSGYCGFASRHKRVVDFRCVPQITPLLSAGAPTAPQHRRVGVAHRLRDARIPGHEGGATLLRGPAVRNDRLARDEQSTEEGSVVLAFRSRQVRNVSHGSLEHVAILPQILRVEVRGSALSHCQQGGAASRCRLASGTRGIRFSSLGDKCECIRPWLHMSGRSEHG